MGFIDVTSIRQLAFGWQCGMKFAGALRYNGACYVIVSASRDDIYVSEVSSEPCDRFKAVLPRSKTSDGSALTQALRSTPAEPATLDGEELRQLVRSGVDLCKTNFQNVDFGATDFSDLDLREIKFIGCSFRGVLFVGATLQGAIFQDCDIEWTNFAGAKAEQDPLAGDAGRAQFRDCSLICSSFDGKADFSGALFIRCIGRATGWETAKLERAVFVNCYLSHGDFSQASLKGATFVGLNRETPKGLPEPFDADRHLSFGHFRPVTLTRADLSQATFFDCQLSGTAFNRPILNFTRVIRTNVAQCSLEGDDVAVEEIHVDAMTRQSSPDLPLTPIDPAWDAADALQNRKLLGDLWPLVGGEFAIEE